MPELLEILLLAIAAAFWPILIAVVVVALRSPHPEKLLVSFYAGALATTMAVGLAVVYVLQGTSLVTTSRPSLDPAVDLAIGVLALVSAYLLRRREIRSPRKHEPSRGENKSEGPSRWETLLNRGAPLAFVAGILLNIFPGLSPLVALKDIAELDLGVAGTAVLILTFYLVMFAFIEAPLVGYLVAPHETRNLANRFNDWLDTNARNIAIYALGGAGAYLIVRGVISLVT